jgi:hypothetical protein
LKVGRISKTCIASLETKVRTIGKSFEHEEEILKKWVANLICQWSGQGRGISPWISGNRISELFAPSSLGQRCRGSQGEYMALAKRARFPERTFPSFPCLNLHLLHPDIFPHSTCLREKGPGSPDSQAPMTSPQSMSLSSSTEQAGNGLSGDYPLSRCLGFLNFALST